MRHTRGLFGELGGGDADVLSEGPSHRLVLGSCAVASMVCAPVDGEHIVAHGEILDTLTNLEYGAREVVSDHPRQRRVPDAFEKPAHHLDVDGVRRRSNDPDDNEPWPSSRPWHLYD